MDPRKNRIIVAIDSSPISRMVACEAAEIARALSSDVILVSVIPMPSLAMAESDVDHKELKDDEKAYFLLHKKLMDEFFADGKLLVESKILHGDPARKISEFADASNSRLIIIGNRGIGHLQSFFLGSISEAVVRNSRVSVLIVKG